MRGLPARLFGPTVKVVSWKYLLLFKAGRVHECVGKLP